MSKKMKNYDEPKHATQAKVLNYLLEISKSGLIPQTNVNNHHDFGKFMGINSASAAALSRLINGERRIKAKEIASLAEHFGIPLDLFETWSDERKNECDALFSMRRNGPSWKKVLSHATFVRDSILFLEPTEEKVKKEKMRFATSTKNGPQNIQMIPAYSKFFYKIDSSSLFTESSAQQDWRRNDLKFYSFEYNNRAEAVKFNEGVFQESENKTFWQYPKHTEYPLHFEHIYINDQIDLVVIALLGTSDHPIKISKDVESEIKRGGILKIDTDVVKTFSEYVCQAHANRRARAIKSQIVVTR